MNKNLMRTGLIMVLLVLLAALAVPAFAQDGPTEVPSARGADGIYLVQLRNAPVLGYEGDLRGYPATRPENGRKLNPNNNNVRKYVAFLNGKHDNALKAVGADPRSQKFYDYYYSLNGFAAELNAAQAEALSRHPDVLMVWEDELHTLDTDNSSTFLGLDAPGTGLWSMGYDGEDIIVGVIDTGAWPEHPSFSDQTDLADRPGESGKRSRAYGPPPADWYGVCQSGELWSQDDCNNKLIGARYFLAGFTRHGIFTDEYASARDRDGHGTHTASTAAGNANVPATILGGDFGTISGMAPRARIAVYKALWNGDAGGGYTTDLVAAIDAAVADGVDVINYSIGSDTPSITGPDEIAFLLASRAGVFVAASAGNAGPDPETVGSPAAAPWLTTVAASTQNRTFEGKVTLGNAFEYFGASVTGGVGPLPLVDAADAGDELCGPGMLDPNVVAGRIVLCKRGAYARVDKSLAVAMAGGMGMVLYNNTEFGTVTDNHWVPSVHVENADGLAIKAYIAGNPNPTATITGGVLTAIDAPWMADFSSRGPNGASYDLLKPDVTAPGVNILAGNTPNPFTGASGQLFQAISGTSMSSPHVAGIAALLVQAHPTWTPDMLKSALMTTAYQSVMKEDGGTPADPFDIGAGHIAPNSAVDPGLVYNTGFNDYLAFLCGYEPSLLSPSTCPALGGAGYSFDASNLNVASVAIGELAGTQTVTRRVRNVGSAGTYTPSVEPIPGVDVVVAPASLNLAANTTGTFSVTFTVTDDSYLDTWQFGGLTWSDGTHNVRIPLVVKPVALAAPGSLSLSGASGSTSYDVTFGYTGDFNAAANGLVAATLTPGYVVDDPANDINTALGTGVGITMHEVTIPAGSVYARFSLFDGYTDGADDLDLYVFDSAFNYMGGSGSGTSAEEVNVVAPADTTYYVIVHGWGTDGPDANYTLFSWGVAPGNAGNWTVTAPASVTLGATASVDITWGPLDPGKWLGYIVYDNGFAEIGSTVVAVNVP